MQGCLDTASAAWPQLGRIVDKLGVPFLVAQTASKLGNALLDLSVLNERRFLTFTFTSLGTGGAQPKPSRMTRVTRVGGLIWGGVLTGMAQTKQVARVGRRT